MKKIVIIELNRGNHEVADLCKMANPSKAMITLFIGSKIEKSTKEDLEEFKKDINIIAKNPDQRYLSFISTINRYLVDNKIDLTIINTLSRWELLFLKKKTLTFCFIYSLNFWLRDIENKKTAFKISLAD